MIRRIKFASLGDVVVESAPSPSRELGSDQVLIAPEIVGVCGSDLHVLHGNHPWIKPPVITGHEVAGRVIQVGRSVTDLAVGDGVVINPLLPCLHCARCRAGSFNTCEAAKVLGFRLPGAAQTEYVLPRAQLHKVPDGLALRDAVLAEPLAVGIRAAQRWNALDEVLVIGAGTIGLCVLAALRARGAGRITVLEPVASKRTFAVRHGADAALPFDALEPTPHYTACFDCVASQATIDLACSVALPAGAIIIVGVAGAARSFNLPRLQRFEIALLGTAMYLAADIDRALGMLANGTFHAPDYVTSLGRLANAPAAYAQAMRPDSIKALIAMT
jgi:threonine dehydrogenase-like Zn-dependent dehydrogenase